MLEIIFLHMQRLEWEAINLFLSLDYTKEIKDMIITVLLSIQIDHKTQTYDLEADSVNKWKFKKNI